MKSCTLPPLSLITLPAHILAPEMQSMDTAEAPVTVMESARPDRVQLPP